MRIGIILLQCIVAAFLLVIPFQYFVAEPFIVSGVSMEPTFGQSEYLVIDRLTYRFHLPLRDEVVVFRYPLDPSLYFIKRIVGLPGETIHIARGAITVENAAGVIEETRTTTEDALAAGEGAANDYTTTLAGDEYFVLGDNVSHSSDSRQWGPLQKVFIVGRPVARAWPIQKAGLFPGISRLRNAN